jgi:hypothetical protein
VLALSCAAILGASVHAAVTPHTAPRIVLKPLPVVVLPPQAPVAPATAAPTLAVPAPTAAPGQVKGIQAPRAGILPPVATLPVPSQGHAST